MPKAKELSCLFSIGILLKKKLLKGWLYINFSISLNIHKVPLQLTSIPNLYSSALHPCMQMHCIHGQIVLLHTHSQLQDQSEFKPTEASWFPFQ